MSNCMPWRPIEVHFVRRLMASCLVLAVFCTGCGTDEDDAGQPTIRDSTPEWGAGEEARFFQAEVHVTAPWELSSVSISYSRHAWPGPGDAHEGVAGRVEGEQGRYRFAVPGAAGYNQCDTVFYQWHLECRLGESEYSENVTYVEAPIQRFVVGCSKRIEDSQLQEDQRVVLSEFDIPDPHLWRSDDGDVPSVSILPPFHVPGLVLPSGTFFMSEMFE
jgi:hypothetical protein